MNNLEYLPREFTGDLIVAARLWRQMVREATARFGIAEAGVAPLVWIGRMGDGVRQTQLANRIGLEDPSLVRVIGELRAAGLVERRPDPTDRRAKALHLTDKGRALVVEVEEELNALRARVLGSLVPADIAAAQRVIAAINLAAGRAPVESMAEAD